MAALDRLVAKAHRMRGCRLLDAVAALKRAYREQSSPDSLSEARGAALQGSLGGKPLPQHLARVCRVNVTPTRVVCFPPEIEVTNRVCRLFGPAAAEECLLRVSFCDENMKASAAAHNSSRAAGPAMSPAATPAIDHGPVLRVSADRL